MALILGYVDLAPLSGTFEVPLLDSLSELVHKIRLNQIYCASTEAGACQSGTEDAVKVHRGVHEDV